MKQAIALGFTEVPIQTTHFKLFSLVRVLPQKKEVAWVYLEGDGKAYVNRSTVSHNPTPQHPVALKLAMSHTKDSVVYLARACQYFPKQALCQRHMWTTARYGQKALLALDEALTKLKECHQLKQFVIVGYSGGGNLAAILAAKRRDIVGLVTVAGNLNHRLWTKWHHVSPLAESLNAVDYLDCLRKLPQLHLVGEQDISVPLITLLSYQDGLHSALSSIELIPEQTHFHGWENKWPQLLEQKIIPFFKTKTI